MLYLLFLRFLKFFRLLGRVIIGLTGISILLKRYYWKELIRRAPELGLEHKPSEFYYKFGELHGTVEGRKVIIEIEDEGPSSGVSIQVPLEGPGPLQLLGRKPVVRPESGWEDFKTHNIAFNYLYGTRRKATNLDSAKVEAVSTLLVDFYIKHALILKEDVGSNGLNLDESYLRVWLNIGGGFTPYISPNKLSALLPDCVGLAKNMEAAWA